MGAFPGPAMLRRYRLLPMAIVPDGHVVWTKQPGCRLEAIWTPERPCDPTDDTDTACLSVADYRRVTHELADGEEASPTTKEPA